MGAVKRQDSFIFFDAGLNENNVHYITLQAPKTLSQRIRTIVPNFAKFY
jgi:hypothetical protein